MTYIILNEDPSPRMLIHNKCPIPLLLKETVKGGTPRPGLTSHLRSSLWSFVLTVSPLCSTEAPRAEVFCRPLPANSSLHHELYHHFSSFPECRQKELLPSLLLKTTSEHSSTDWTEPIDINCPGTQVRETLLLSCDLNDSASDYHTYKALV